MATNIRILINARPRPLHRLLLTCSVLSTLGSAAGAQTPAGSGVFVGSELEEYLRVLQVSGRAAVHPWSIRSFSPREVDRLDVESGPWADRWTFLPDTTGGVRFQWIGPGTKLVYNSAFPYGRNDGAVWAGRGVTAVVRAGFAVRAGPLSLRVEPVAFAAQNSGFELAETGRTGNGIFADPESPGAIDLPQRFGDGTYWRVDPGESTLRLDLPILSAGVSTASQHWGPARDHPLILGNTAGGFPHAFLGTSSPVNVWVGKVHGRLIWGEPAHTVYAPSAALGRRRFASGAVATFVPRGVPGLEIGGSRFFHSPWPENGLAIRHFLKPLEGLLKESLPDAGGVDRRSDPDNQLASVFFRWLFPSSGAEVYGEFAREDHSWDGRDLLAEPDHDSGYMLGVAGVWDLSGGRLLRTRAEVVNTRITHLVRVRPQTRFYHHSEMVTGHTHVGQPLGSAAGYGGGGSVFGADLYHPGGRLTIEWDRLVRGAPPPGRLRSPDVLNSLKLESLVFRGPMEWVGGVTATYEMNRHYEGNELNLNLSIAGRWIGPQIRHGSQPRTEP